MPLRNHSAPYSYLIPSTLLCLSWHKIPVVDGQVNVEPLVKGFLCQKIRDLPHNSFVKLRHFINYNSKHYLIIQASLETQEVGLILCEL
jgi:hypothetical protein